MTLYVTETYTRRLLENNRDKIFIFGDNVAREGKGGQAEICRGHPNIFGVPTKWYPSNAPKAFFMEDQAEEIIILFLKPSFDALDGMLATGVHLVWPSPGIGTGRAQLSITAPSLMDYLNQRKDQLFSMGGEIQNL